MSPLLSTLLISLPLPCGAAAAVVMMNRLDRPQSDPSPRQIVLHRVFGRAFVVALVVLIAAESLAAAPLETEAALIPKA